MSFLYLLMIYCLFFTHVRAIPLRTIGSTTRSDSGWTESGPTTFKDFAPSDSTSKPNSNSPSSQSINKYIHCYHSGAAIPSYITHGLIQEVCYKRAMPGGGLIVPNRDYYLRVHLSPSTPGIDPRYSYSVEFWVHAFGWWQWDPYQCQLAMNGIRDSCTGWDFKGGKGIRDVPWVSDGVYFRIDPRRDSW